MGATTGLLALLFLGVQCANAEFSLSLPLYEVRESLGTSENNDQTQ